MRACWYHSGEAKQQLLINTASSQPSQQREQPHVSMMQMERLWGCHALRIPHHSRINEVNAKQKCPFNALKARHARTQWRVVRVERSGPSNQRTRDVGKKHARKLGACVFLGRTFNKRLGCCSLSGLRRRHFVAATFKIKSGSGSCSYGRDHSTTHRHVIMQPE